MPTLPLPQSPREPSSNLRRTLGVGAGVVGPMLFIASFTIEGWLRPGYDVRSRLVSELSLGHRGSIQIASFVVLGASILLFGQAIAAALPSGRASRAGPALLAIVGLGYLVSGPFVMDAWAPGSPPTLHGLVHGIAGAVVFSLSPVACLLYASRFRREPPFRWIASITFTIGVTSCVALVLFTVAIKPPFAPNALTPFRGLVQRIAILANLAWIPLAALALRESDGLDEPRRREPRALTSLGFVLVVAAGIIAWGGWLIQRGPRSGELHAMLQSIRGAEDAYRAETLVYLGCSPPNGLADPAAYYPRPISEFGRDKVPWEAPTHPHHSCWKELGVSTGGPVRGSYAVVAGAPGPMKLEPPPGVPRDRWPFDGRKISQRPYFVAIGIVLDGDGNRVIAYTSSFDGEVTDIDPS